ncbi:ribonuclease P protein component [Rickettsiella massiliensis]|uniref:ribonuclease P protein component n=1 Tax=Rickettsiella massiliensis TaxID=676517 RepID=UPI00029A44BE|nr:ribonuclease P protein component [Rickettsiella massiliensis]
MIIEVFLDKTRYSFPRSRRVGSPEDFTTVFKEGFRFKQGCLIMYIKPNGLLCPRLGLAVSKKAIPKAAERNKVKRLIRESFRLYQNQLANIDIVVVVTRHYFEAQPSFWSDLGRQWSKLVVYYKEH